MRRSFLTSSACPYLLAAVLLLLFVAGADRRLERVWAAQGLSRASASASLTPLQVLSSMVGGFRGLFLDLVWMRAIRLQDEGRLFESALLSQVIVETEPHFPEVWTYLAWNLAYNISIEYATPQERWPWVNKGIETLKQGIARNPQSYRLRWELGFLFFHKMVKSGGDEHHAQFQRLFLATERERPDFAGFLDHIRGERNGTLPEGPRADEEYMYEFALRYFREADRCPDAPLRLTRRAIAQVLELIPARWPEAEKAWIALVEDPAHATALLREEAFHDLLCLELHWAIDNAADARKKGQADRLRDQEAERDRVYQLFQHYFPEQRGSPEELVREWLRSYKEK